MIALVLKPWAQRRGSHYSNTQSRPGESSKNATSPPLLFWPAARIERRLEVFHTKSPSSTPFRRRKALNTQRFNLDPGVQSLGSLTNIADRQLGTADRRKTYCGYWR